MVLDHDGEYIGGRPVNLSISRKATEQGAGDAGKDGQAQQGQYQQHQGQFHEQQEQDQQQCQCRATRAKMAVTLFGSYVRALVA